ncbi:GspE/PulE/PilB domain-containing protein [Hyalangium gracile]|uniref:GspE/PulE/PilB domain-containing protein n=1 Tax=Hyalangium gracile TaxID=394092 RepID=UPI001CC9FAAE|nr:FHA domain-containing protein [Hyalangium gracile]
MDEKPIQNCEVRFQFRCPKQWEALRETSEPGVRSCSQCQKQVYLCQSTQEVAEHARAGHCVAVPRWVAAPKDSPADFEQVQALAQEHGLRAIRLDAAEPASDVVKLVPMDVARKHGLIPVGRDGSTLLVAMSRPADTHAIDDVKFLTGYHVEVVLASRQEIERALNRADEANAPYMELGVVACYDEPEPEPEPDLLKGPVGKLIRGVMRDIHRNKASQARIEATDTRMVVQYETEGGLREGMRFPLKLREELLRQLRHASGAGAGHEGQLQLQLSGQPLRFQVLIQAVGSREQVVLVPLEKYTSPELYLVTGTGAEIPVTGERFVIGRTEGSDFRPDSLILSRRHAVILREGDDYFLEDLASSSGTWLNHELILGRRQLSEGDEISLADVKLRARFR